MYGFFTILETTTLMASSLRHNGQIQSLHHQNLAPWPKTAFDIAQILSLFISFLVIEILELTVTKHLLTYLHLNLRNKFIRLYWSLAACSSHYSSLFHSDYSVNKDNTPCRVLYV